MKQVDTIAIPTWELRVAPRFGVADVFTVVPITDGRQGERRMIYLESTMCWSERLSRLKEQGVAVVICSGFNRRFMPLAESMGLQIMSGISGDIDAVVKQYQHGALVRHKCSGRRRRQRAGSIR